MLYRITGMVFVILGLLVLGVNLLVALENGRFLILSLGEAWSLLASQSFQSAFGAQADPDALQGVAGFILRFPAFAPFLILGLILILSQPRKRKGIFRSKTR